MSRRPWHGLGRLAYLLPSLWLLASLVFLLSHGGPVQATDVALPDAADLSGSHQPLSGTQLAMRQAMQQRMGLHLPLFYFTRDTASATGKPQWHWHGQRNQYHRWAAQLLRGKLGTSLHSGQPVGSALAAALRYTVPLVSLALLLTLALAVPLALVLAAQPPGPSVLLASLTTLQALPLFALALGLLLALANPEALNWFPVFGLEQAGPLEVGNVRTYLYYTTLPVLSLVLSALPALSLQLAASLRRELARPYLMAARTKGLSLPQVLRRHALRNAVLPLITQLTDLLPTLVAGTVVVEQVFAVPGMGRLLARAAVGRDYPLLVSGILLIGGMRVLALLLADALYRRADPRLAL